MTFYSTINIAIIMIAIAFFYKNEKIKCNNVGQLLENIKKLENMAIANALQLKGRPKSC